MRFKFITLNIEHGGKLMDNILSFLSTEKPDLLFLQEVYNSTDLNLERRFRTVEVFKENFSESLPYHDFKGIAYDPVIKAEVGNAIFSKFPLRKSGSKFFDVPYGEVNFTGKHDPPSVPRAVQYATIDIDDHPILLLNLHGIWANYGGDSDRRVKMAEDIVSLIPDKTPVILAGDTNFTSDAVKTIETFENRGLQSVFKKELISTFNMAYKSNPGYATAAVDMIFVTDDLKVVDHEMPTVDVSDHYPLEAIIEL